MILQQSFSKSISHYLWTMKLSSAFGAFALASSAIARQNVSTFDWFGINLSGLEDGYTELPGEYGRIYTSPDPNDITSFKNSGYNIFRVMFLMERLAPSDIAGLTGPFNETYFSYISDTVKTITDLGAYATICPWNFGRYHAGSAPVALDDFQAFWKNVATRFSANNLVIFDTNNEYNFTDAEGGAAYATQLNQAAITGIRSAGANSQFIFVEGNDYTPAYNWAPNAVGMEKLTDPAGDGKIVYEMHLYFDANRSGGDADCSQPGAGSVTDATQWLRANGKVGIIGETAAAATDQCRGVLVDMLDHLRSNTDVWAGAMWWNNVPAAWANPPSYSVFVPGVSPAYNYYNSVLQPYRSGLQLQA